MTRFSTIRQVISLAGWLLLSFAAAGVGAVVSVSADVFINSSYVQSGLHLHGFLVQCGPSYIYSWELLPGL